MSTIKERHANQMMRFQTAIAKEAVRMLEALPEFARDPDEDDWISLQKIEQEVYTETGLMEMRASVRRLQYTPYGQCILNTLQNFVIGKSAKISSLDDMPEFEDVNHRTAQAFWDEWADANDWDRRSKETIRRIFRDGEVFWRWFTPGNEDEGLQLRFIDVQQIQRGTADITHGIRTDPQDIEKILGYHRQWQDDKGVLHDEDIEADEIDHHKILVDRSVKRGVSYFVPMARYVREYEKWLQDRITLNKIRHLFNVVAEPLNPTASLASITDKFDDETKAVSERGTKNKKIWKPGSVLATKGVKWDLKSLNINASDTKDDGRAIQLMLAIATGFPEYIIRGDASNANYSSSMVSESPFVRMIQYWQDDIAGLFKCAFRRVVQYGLDEGIIPARFKRTIVSFDRTKGTETETQEENDVSIKCQVNYDSVIARNLKEDTEAVQIHVNEGWCSKKTGSEKFGYKFEDEQDQIAREDEEALEKQKRMGLDPAHLAALQNQNGGNNEDGEEDGQEDE